VAVSQAGSDCPIAFYLQLCFRANCFWARAAACFMPHIVAPKFYAISHLQAHGSLVCGG
jgi:hypothetical protein